MLQHAFRHRDMRSLSNRFFDDIQRAVDRMCPHPISSDRSEMPFAMMQVMDASAGEVHEPLFVHFSTGTREAGDRDGDTRSRSPQSAVGHCLGDFSALTAPKFVSSALSTPRRSHLA